MTGRASPDLSELAYHIIRLCDFWRRSGSHSPKGNVVHVIGNMIGISLGVDHPDRIARAVILELDAIRMARTDQEVDPEGIEVGFIAALLQEQAGELAVPATTAQVVSGFDLPHRGGGGGL